MVRFFLWLALVMLAGLWPVQGLSAEKQYPQRVVSLGPIVTENVYLLGAGDRLVANTSYCVHPPEARDKVKIGSVMQFNIEQILSLKPDLILATGLTSPRQVAQLAATGVRVVHFHQPAGFAAICDQLLELGELLGLESRAREIVAEAREQVRAIQERVRGLPPVKVFLQVGATPLFASVESSFTHDFIVLAGGVNAAAGRFDGRCHDEMVTVWNPDVILIAIMGSEGAMGAREKEKWLRFPAIAAVREGRVFVVDPDLFCSPSPMSFVRGLRQAAELIHPPEEGRPLSHP